MVPVKEPPSLVPVCVNPRLVIPKRAEPFRREQCRTSEIGDLDLGTAVGPRRHQDVSGLQILVQNVQVVRLAQRRGRRPLSAAIAGPAESLSSPPCILCPFRQVRARRIRSRRSTGGRGRSSTPGLARIRDVARVIPAAGGRAVTSRFKLLQPHIVGRELEDARLMRPGMLGEPDFARRREVEAASQAPLHRVPGRVSPGRRCRFGPCGRGDGLSLHRHGQAVSHARKRDDDARHRPGPCGAWTRPWPTSYPRRSGQARPTRAIRPSSPPRPRGAAVGEGLPTASTSTSTVRPPTRSSCRSSSNSQSANRQMWPETSWDVSRSTVGNPRCVAFLRVLESSVRTPSTAVTQTASVRGVRSSPMRLS